MLVDYFYDGQIRRFLLQIVRAFSGFQYETGKREDGTTQFKVVPCRMANQNRQVGHILRNNSENSLMSAPLITVFIKDMELNRNRTQAPGFMSTVQVNERSVDPSTGQYTSDSGAKYTVDRMMPHPLDANIQVDVWTSNEMMKHQLFEQIFMAFNVGFDIQSSDNPIDWTALSTLSLETISWSSRSIPIGTSDEIDIMSFTFKLPMWISPPAKVKQQNVIQQIVTNIREGTSDDDRLDGNNTMPSGSVMIQNIITPGNYEISIMGDEITLEPNGIDQNPDWKQLLSLYGTTTPASSQIRLRADLDQVDELDIIGTIQFHSTKPNVLLWQVGMDTLPINTLTSVHAIINPLTHFPGRELPVNTLGDRYLILNDMGPSQVWGNITAHTGDIIEYGNLGWSIVFKASDSLTTQYIVNQRSNKQLRFSNGSWIMAIDGTYHAGFWRILL